jgi:hypothetical protein
MLVLLLAAALVCVPGWTQADISGTDPPASSCLCLTSSSVFVRDSRKHSLTTNNKPINVGDRLKLRYNCYVYVAVRLNFGNACSNLRAESERAVIELYA